jgi:hypothetical protein
MCWRHSGRWSEEPNRRTNGGALAQRGVARERRGGGRRGSNGRAEDETCAGVARDRKGVSTYEGDEQAVFRKMLSAKNQILVWQSPYETRPP